MLWCATMALFSVVRANESMFAVILEDAATFEKYVKEGADVNYADSEGMTLLMAATARGKPEIVSLLLHHGANIHSVEDLSGNTVSHVAVMYGRADILRMLLDAAGEKPLANAANKEGRNLLHLSCGRDDDAYAEMTRMILNEGVSKEMLNHADREGNSPLYVALTRGHKESAVAVINAGADVAATWEAGKTTLHLASIRRGFTDVADIALKKGVCINAKDRDGASPIMQSAICGNVETFKFLLDAGADVHASSDNGFNLLHWVVLIMKKGSEELVDILLRKNVNINAQSVSVNTPLHLALKAGNKAAAWKLIESGANIELANAAGELPLHIASTHYHMSDILEALLSRTNNVNVKNEDDKTALNIAANCSLVENTKILIRNGADVNNPAHGDVTPLMSVAMWNTSDNAEEMTEILIDAGARIGNATLTSEFMKNLHNRVSPPRTKMLLRALPDQRFYHQLLDDVVQRQTQRLLSPEPDAFQKCYARIAGHLITFGADTQERANDTLRILSPKISGVVENIKTDDFGQFLQATICMHVITHAGYIPKTVVDLTDVYMKSEALAAYRILKKYYAEANGKNLGNVEKFEESLRESALRYYDLILMKIISGTYLEKLPMGVLYDTFDNVSTTFVRVTRKLTKFAWSLALVEKITKWKVMKRGRFKDPLLIEKCFPGFKSRNKYNSFPRACEKEIWWIRDNDDV